MPSIPIGVQSYRGDTPVSAERLINCFPERAPETATSRVFVRGIHGAELWIDLEVAVGATGAIVATATWKGDLYVATTRLYKIDSNKVVTDLGDIAGPELTQLVPMFNHLVVVNGNAWFTDGATLTAVADPGIANFTQFNAGATIGRAMLYLDTSSGVMVWSEIDDPGNILGTSFLTAEAVAEEARNLVVANREIYIFGQTTTEVFFDTGQTGGGRFVRQGNGVIERGMAGRNAVCETDNALHFLGDDGIFYRLNGRTPVRISDHGQETPWAQYVTRSDAQCFPYTWNGHKFIVMTFPLAAETWVYDLNTGVWHERLSKDLGRWRANAHARVFDTDIVGDFSSPKLYELTDSRYDEAGNEIQWQVQLAPIADPQDRRWLFMRRLEVKFESGVGTVSGNAVNPEIRLDWSDDQSNTFGPGIFRECGAGKAGDYDARVVWNNLGRFKQRTYRFSGSDPYKMRLILVFADIEAGEV